MRRLAVAGALLTLIAVPAIEPADAAKAKAQPARYCARYIGGAENCGFSSMQQCLQSLSGSGGNCLVVQEMPRPKKLAPVTPLSPRDEDDD